ncbi:MAG: hypothetical protein NVS3B20_02630 [Polyangiales bacterium]
MTVARHTLVALCFVALGGAACTGVIEGASLDNSGDLQSGNDGVQTKANAPTSSGVDSGADPSSGAGPIQDAGVVSETGTQDSKPISDAGIVPSAAAKYISHEVTFYGWADNSPPGASISNPTLHPKAGGVGTFANPITFATDSGEWAPGTILYVPFIRKYVVLEDLCGRCTTDWASGHRHIDVWMNSDSTNLSQLLKCENNWTRSFVDVEVNPPATRKVTTVPLFDPSSGLCRTTP